jgi:hypothetical protein
MILDALKRAERERKLEKAPDLSAIYQEERLEKRKAKQWFWLGGAFLVTFVAAAIIFWPKEPSKPAVTASSSQEKVLPKNPNAPNSATPKNSQHIPPPTAASAQQKPSKTQASSPPFKKSTPVAQKDEKPAPAPIRATLQKEPESAAAPPPNEVIRASEPAPAPVTQPVVATVRETRTTAAVKVVPETKPKKVLPSFDDLSEEIQSVSGPLEINVHMYSPKPSERRVFINMKGYREGDFIGESGFKLVEITSNGAVIDTGKGKALLEVKRK